MRTDGHIAGQGDGCVGLPQRGGREPCHARLPLQRRVDDNLVDRPVDDGDVDDGDLDNRHCDEHDDGDLDDDFDSVDCS